MTIDYLANKDGVEDEVSEAELDSAVLLLFLNHLCN